MSSHLGGLSQLTPRTILVCLMIALGIVFGGGGTSAPRSELLLELFLAATAGAWMVSRRSRDADVAPGAIVVAGMVVALPILQLIPLPPELWRRLPGRAIEADVLGLVDAGARWMPWTVSPGRTAASLIAMLPAAFVLCIASSLDREGRRMLLTTIAIFGFVSLLLGALQLADGTERSWRFYVDNPGYLNGFQANRNAEVDVLLIALAAFICGLAPTEHQRESRGLPALLAVGGAVALLLGCVLTGSRAGILIGCLMMPVLLWPWRAALIERRRGIWLGGALLLLSLSVSVLMQWRGSALAQVGERFTWDRDVRLDLWRDTIPALRSVWPAGGGIGTFRPLFEAAEPLTSIDPTLPVRAHDEYLEFVLEGGAAAIVVLAAIVFALALGLRRARKVAPRRNRPTLVFIVTTFGIVALHSLVDYPFRSVSLAHLVAAASGMLFAIVREGTDFDRVPEPRGE